MPVIAFVSTIWSRPEVELTHTICPCWQMNPVSLEKCSAKFYIHPRKERKVVFCFHTMTLSLTSSESLASGFLRDLWLRDLCSTFSPGLSPSPVHFFSIYRGRETDYSPLPIPKCEGSLSLATTRATFLWDTLLLSASYPLPKIQKLALPFCLSFLRWSGL